MIKIFLSSLFFIFSFLSLVCFLVLGKVNYFKILIFSILFSLIFSILIFYKEKIENFISFKILIFSIFTIFFTYLFSSYENFKFLDNIFGENFSKNLIEEKFEGIEKLIPPEFLERKIYAEESLEVKVKEFRENRERLEKEIHNLVNKYRAQNNLNILNFNETLRDIARYHSKDMKEKDYFDHISPSGETLKDRFSIFNYTCKIIFGNYVYEGAENLFLGYIYSEYTYDKISKKVLNYSFYTLEELAKEVVNAWIKSEGHRKNLIFEHWKNEGIGVEISDDGKVYVTQVFC
jgi:uncharacterized protein YkwD